MGSQAHVTPVHWTPRGEAWVAGKGHNKPMVVWGAIPGEGAMVRIQGSGQHRVHADFMDTRTPDKHRVDPPCDRYFQCGGCPWMHLDPTGQEAAHRQLVIDSFREEGFDKVPIDAWHPCPDGHRDFRHVVKLGVGQNETGRTRVGAWGRANRRIVPIPHCLVAAPNLNKVMMSLAHHTIELDVWPWDPVSDRGVLRAAVLRSSRTTGEILVTLVAARQSSRLRDLAEAVGQACSEVTGIWLHLNNDPGNAIFQRDDEGTVHVLPLAGKEAIPETVGGVEYRIGPGDFFQTNPSVAEVLYDRVMERLNPGKDDAFVDLYSGVGGMALQAAKRGAGFVVGVEAIEGAVTRARTAARINRLSAEFLVGRVDQVVPDLARRLEGVGPLVAVNPARRGLEEGVIEEIAALKPRKLAYISCNPRALARDMHELAKIGLVAREGLELFDMFPNTPHVEVLVVLEAEQPQAPSRRVPRRKVVRSR